MADIDYEAEFDEAFKGFGEDPAPASPAAPADVPAPSEPPAAAEPPAAPKEEPKKDDKPATPPSEEPKKDDETTPPASDEKQEEGDPKPATPPETPPEPQEESKPLTKEDVTSIITNLRNDERNSGKIIENTTQEVLDAYYPDGLSNTLTTPDGKELNTPQDVVEASNGEMTTEQATQWLMNEQFKLDKSVSQIKDDARKVAETTVNFRRDSVAALQKYEPLFKAYPHLEKKVFEKLMKYVKADTDKGVILQAPDVMEHYDDYLEPYQQAYEFSTKQPATNAVTPPEAPPAPTPGAEDRLDEGGDGGSTAPDDPNDFAQQVKKELAKGL